MEKRNTAGEVERAHEPRRGRAVRGGTAQKPRMREHDLARSTRQHEMRSGGDAMTRRTASRPSSPRAHLGEEGLQVLAHHPLQDAVLARRGSQHVVGKKQRQRHADREGGQQQDPEHQQADAEHPP